MLSAPKISTKFSALSLNPLTTSSCLVFGAAQYSGGDFGTYDAALKQTTDGGENWAENELTKIGAIQYASFYTTTEGYAVSGNGLIRVQVK